MRTLIVAVALLGLVAAAGTVSAEIGTIDNVPAATLLLPYFEVDLSTNNGQTTLFSINNASATAVLARVTLWTDASIPTFAFDVYLTGYDVQTINLRDIFNGNLPVTADDGADPSDTISPQGNIAGQQDINFGGSVGPCGDASTLYNAPDPSLPFKIAHIRAAHNGKSSPVFGGRCSGANYFDTIARGYITVDTVNFCTLDFPSTPGYFSGVATHQNVLWGDYFYVNPGENFAQGDTLVHIESCGTGGYVGVGNGAGHCPFGAGDYTFYGRYVSGFGTDQRESLATTFATRYINGGAFGGGTDLLVWRDPKTPLGAPGAANGPFNCGSKVTWSPLIQADVVAFDEQENATGQCFLVDNVPPAIGGTQPCFPLATQRIHTQGGNIIAADLELPSNFGWLYLNLNTTVAGGLFNPTAQAWVTTSMSAEGRFSVGFSAIQFDNANATFNGANPGGNILPLGP